MDPGAISLYLNGLTAQWYTSANPSDFTSLEAAVRSVVAPDGTLLVPITQAQPFGQAILLCFRVSRNPIFYRASRHLRDSLQPVEDKAESSVAPFLADFARTFHDRSAADQAAAILLGIDGRERNLEPVFSPPRNRI